MINDYWVQMILTVFTTMMASGGFWAYIQTRANRHSDATKLMLGLAHERIIEKGMQHIRAGYITKEEYDDFMKYLYQPYFKIGGNGLADRVKKEVDSLPLYAPNTQTGPIDVTERNPNGQDH